VRVRPTALAAIAIFLGYVALISIFWAGFGLDYDEVGDTAASVREGIVVPVGLGALYVAILASVLGWWKPAMSEARVGRRWMWLVPGVLLVGAIGNFATVDWDGIESEYLLWLAVGTAFVGFSEEMLTRGLAIVGARGSMHEKWVWVFSSALFGLLHVANALFGQSLKATIGQVIFAFLVGIAYYVTRRISGTLLVTMGLHFLWDFSLFAHDQSTDDRSPTSILMIVAIILGIAALVKVLRHGDVVETHAEPHAEVVA
jgi:membrane protease YdiL (CAAX protease family)